MPPHLHFVTTLPSKTHTNAHIAMLHFHNICNISKFSQNKLISTYSVVTYLFTAILCDDTKLRLIVFMRLLRHIMCLMLLVVVCGLKYGQNRPPNERQSLFDKGSVNTDTHKSWTWNSIGPAGRWKNQVS